MYIQTQHVGIYQGRAGKTLASVVGLKCHRFTLENVAWTDTISSIIPSFAPGIAPRKSLQRLRCSKNEPGC